MKKTRYAKIIAISSAFVFVVALAVALPFLIANSFAEVTPRAIYEISNQTQLQDWLTNVNSVQSNNPSAKLTQDITLEWRGDSSVAGYGGVVIANHNAEILQGSTLDGDGHTIYLPGYASQVTTANVSTNEIAFFADIIYGTVKNIHFVVNGTYDMLINSSTSKNNQELYSGVVCAKLINGTIQNCALTIDQHIGFNTVAAWTVQTDRTSNRFGGFAGRMEGSAVISNCSVVQNNTIMLNAEEQFGSAFRYGMIAGESYASNGNTPYIESVYAERNSTVTFYNDSSQRCEEIFGVAVADCYESAHGVNINGVVYKCSVGGGSGDGIYYTHRNNARDNYKYSYVVGMMNTGINNYSVQNFYSVTELTDTDYVTNAGCGYGYLPSEYTYKFVNNKLQFTPVSSVENEFIWQITKNASGEVFDVHVNVSNVASITKTNTSTEILKDTFTITKGTIKNNAVFGFTETEVVYNGLAYENVQANIGGEILTNDFKITYVNNLHAFPTTQQQASFALVFDEREDGLFMPNHKYYIPKSGITYENETMLIQPASLKLIYSGSNIYDNELVIQGLVNNEKVTIDGDLYGNNVYSFECLSNSTQKQIEFISCVATDYSIEQLGISDFVFEVLPYTIALTGNVAIEQTNPEWFAVQEDVLQIYSKQVTSFDMKQTNVAGQMHVYTLTSSAPENYTLSRKIDNGMEVVTLQANGTLQQLQGITLTTQMKQIAVRLSLQMPEGDSVTYIVNVNENETLYPMGESLVAVSQYGNEITIVITLDEAYKDTYTLTYMQGEEPITSQNGVLTITTTSVAGDTNLMEMIVVVEKV